MAINQSLNCGQQRPGGPMQNPSVAAAAALEAAAWFGPNGSFAGQLPLVDLAADDVTGADEEDEDDDDDAVQHLGSFSAHSTPPASNQLVVKQDLVE